MVQGRLLPGIDLWGNARFKHGPQIRFGGLGCVAYRRALARPSGISPGGGGWIPLVIGCPAPILNRMVRYRLLPDRGDAELRRTGEPAATDAPCPFRVSANILPVVADWAETGSQLLPEPSTWRPSSRFLAELKRRKVYRVASVYVVVGAGIIGLGEAALPSNIWDGIQIPVGIIILVGLPISLILAWAYELKPEEARPHGPEYEGSPPSPETAAPTGVTATRQRKSIVVLPFDNMSPDPGDAYFADGLTEEIITNLSHIHSLRVISRSSAMALKGTQKDVRTIGRELEVQFVLEGSVRKSADDLRITAQLIDAKTDEHLWAERYDGQLEDVFGVQEDVARSIVDSLQLQLEPDEARRLSEHPIQDLRAYEYFLKATQETWKFTSADAWIGPLPTLNKLWRSSERTPFSSLGWPSSISKSANIGTGP